MANGNFNTLPLYICTKSGKYVVRREDGSLDEHYFSKNDVIGCDGQKYFSVSGWSVNGQPASHWVRLREEVVPNEEKGWFKLNVGYYSKYIYLQEFEQLFRPVIGRHKEVLEFKNEKDLNDWLLDKDPSNVEKIGIMKDRYSVVYINDGDTKYTKDFN